MATVRLRKGKKYSVKVVEYGEQTKILSEQEMEMDKRAVQAVKSAVEKAKFCNKPVARYDTTKGEVYLEYSQGEKKGYVD